jgi:hypothetical protein
VENMGSYGANRVVESNESTSLGSQLRQRVDKSKSR